MKKTIVTIGTAALVLIGSTFAIEPAQVAAERNIDNLKTEQNKLNSKISKVETNIKDILKDIQKIHNEIVALEAEVKENKALIKEVEGQINEHEAEVDKINKRIDERSEILKGRIASYQQSGGNIQFLEVLLGAKNISQFISRVESVTTMTGADQELINEQQADLEEVEVKLTELDEMKVDLEEIDQALKANIAEEKKAKKEISDKEAKLVKEKEKLESDLSSVNSDIAAYEAEIRRAMNQSVVAVNQTTTNNNANTSNDNSNVSKNKSNKASDNSKAVNNNSNASNNSSKSTKLGWPSTGGYISSTFGQRWGRMHNGIDIARTDRSTSPSIVAAESGTVERAGDSGNGYGNMVIINHGNGLKTLYAHLASLNVKVGQKVERGQNIGVMGATGRSTGIHLHFEVHENGSPKNPTAYIR